MGVTGGLPSTERQSCLCTCVSMFYLPMFVTTNAWKYINVGSAAASVNGRSRLIIDKALKRDDGTYMCVAENPAGIRRAIAAVRVKGQTTHHEMGDIAVCVKIHIYWNFTDRVCFVPVFDKSVNEEMQSMTTDINWSLKLYFYFFILYIFFIFWANLPLLRLRSLHFPFFPSIFFSSFPLCQEVWGAFWASSVEFGVELRKQKHCGIQALIFHCTNWV